MRLFFITSTNVFVFFPCFYATNLLWWIPLSEGIMFCCILFQYPSLAERSREQEGMSDVNETSSRWWRVSSGRGASKNTATRRSKGQPVHVTSHTVRPYPRDTYWSYAKARLMSQREGLLNVDSWRIRNEFIICCTISKGNCLRQLNNGLSCLRDCQWVEKSVVGLVGR